MRSGRLDFDGFGRARNAIVNPIVGIVPVRRASPEEKISGRRDRRKKKKNEDATQRHSPGDDSHATSFT